MASVDLAKNPLLIAAVAFGVGVAATTAWVGRDLWLPPTAQADIGPTFRDVDLEITKKDFEIGNGAVWHAWTFNGQLPGPTIKVTAGDILRVTVKNSADLVHSFHTHLAPYPFESDGSQANVITSSAVNAMIAPGASYTYAFQPTTPGIYYYHCHSADGGHPIVQHILQGLYGAIIVEDPNEQEVRDEVIFMAERGFDVTGSGASYYVMNGMGIPGGEKTLEEIHHAGGLAAVAAQFNKTVPIIKMKQGETVRLAVINIGDMMHTFHLHGMDMVSVDQYPGRVHPANVVQLLPGAADRILITPAVKGVWLFHCHVVSHADAGMIGVIVVE